MAYAALVCPEIDMEVLFDKLNVWQDALNFGNFHVACLAAF